jgi:hypothetical protein
MRLHDRPATPVSAIGGRAPLEGPASAVWGGPDGALGRLDGGRVLVVEDDSDSRKLICKLLEMAGATVLCVESVAEAITGAYQSCEPDVVLTDSRCPEQTAST